MNKIFNRIAVAGLAAIFLSCNDAPFIEEEVESEIPVFSVDMTVANPGVDTKTAITIEGSGNNRVGHINWAVGDQVGLYVALGDVQKQQNIRFDNSSADPETFTGNFVVGYFLRAGPLIFLLSVYQHQLMRFLFRKQYLPLLRLGRFLYTKGWFPVATIYGFHPFAGSWL